MLYPKLILSAALQLRCRRALGREPPGMDYLPFAAAEACARG
jgi:hypothetical protein